MAECIICGWTGPQWGSFKSRPARCIRCGSLERQRALFLALVTEGLYPPPHDPWICVSVALEKCLSQRFYKTYFNQSIDISARGVVRKASLVNLPYRDASLDMIVHSHVLEHIRDDKAAVSEAVRVLKNGGVMVSIVPCRGDETEEVGYAKPPHGHWRQYGRSGYIKLLMDGGFQRVTPYGPDWGCDMSKFNLGKDPVFISYKQGEEGANR